MALTCVRRVAFDTAAIWGFYRSQHRTILRRVPTRESLAGDDGPSVDFLLLWPQAERVADPPLFEQRCENQRPSVVDKYRVRNESILREEEPGSPCEPSHPSSERPSSSSPAAPHPVRVTTQCCGLSPRSARSGQTGLVATRCRGQPLPKRCPQRRCQEHHEGSEEAKHHCVEHEEAEGFRGDG